jgi:hypothetical protein
MKKSVLILCVIWIGTVSAQTIYSIPANSKGNRIVLTVANESGSAVASSVEVSLAHIPSQLHFTTGSRLIPEIAVSTEKDCEFIFDVSRSAVIGAVDTMRFLIKDKQGSIWIKQMLVRFEGPHEYRLSQNYPNPFNPTTKIEYQLPFDSKVQLRVYDVVGREVATLVDETRAAGYYDTIFDARALSSGVFFLRIAAEALVEKASYTEVRRMMLLK